MTSFPYIRRWRQKQEGIICIEINISENLTETYTIDPDTALKLSIGEGRTLDPAEIQMLRKADDVVRVVQRLHRFLSYRLRCTEEVRSKLRTWNISPQIQQCAIAYLQRYGILDDRRFAYAFIRQQIHHSAASQRTIHRKLRRFGIPVDIIEEALSVEYNQDAELHRLRVAAERALRRVRSRPREKQYQSVRNYLLRQGYRLESVRYVLSDLFAHTELS